MARAHDGLMMLLTVGRNHTLRLVVFYDGWLSLMIDVISFMMMDVSCMRWFRLINCTCIMDEIEAKYHCPLHMYVLLSLSYL